MSFLSLLARRIFSFAFFFSTSGGQPTALVGQHVHLYQQPRWLDASWAASRRHASEPRTLRALARTLVARSADVGWQTPAVARRRVANGFALAESASLLPQIAASSAISTAQRRPYLQRGAATPRQTRSSSAAMLLSPELIDLGVRLDTFAPQFLWILMIAQPRSEITERVMGPIGPIIGISLVHLAIVLLAATAPGGTEPVLIFADVFDPAKNQLDGMVRLFEVRNFVAEEWPHVLIWDLFVGRAIWLDSLERGTPFTWASLTLTNGIGPPGLLLYILTCLISGKGLPTLGYKPSTDES